MRQVAGDREADPAARPDVSGADADNCGTKNYGCPRLNMARFPDNSSAYGVISRASLQLAELG
jgi:hypothetical protein